MIYVEVVTKKASVLYISLSLLCLLQPISIRFRFALGKQIRSQRSKWSKLFNTHQNTNVGFSVALCNLHSSRRVDPSSMCRSGAPTISATASAKYIKIREDGVRNKKVRWRSQAHKSARPTRFTLAVWAGWILAHPGSKVCAQLKLAHKMYPFSAFAAFHGVCVRVFSPFQILPPDTAHIHRRVARISRGTGWELGACWFTAC